MDGIGGFTARYAKLLTSSYDGVDRIVLNAYYPLGHNPGGFRTWWRRWHEDGDASLDNAHLMRLAGRFARRVKAWGVANAVPVIFCRAGERKHRLAEDYLAQHTVGVGVFMVLVAKAPTTVWKVGRSSAGVIRNLEKKREYVRHYSFHIVDPIWGHVTIKMSGHPPFAAQVILNGHEYVACTAQANGLSFTKEGNCFTRIDEPERLAQVADTLSQPGTAGRLSQVIDSWIYSACLCFGLDQSDQERSWFRYAYSVYQVEHSRNLIFASGAIMERAFDAVVDRTRSRIDVPRLRTLFGVGQRPRRPVGADLTMNQAVVIERPRWNLTVFKVHFGLLTLKSYTKGEHVLRFEAIVHNTRTLHTGRVLKKFPAIVTRLTGMVDRFTTMLDCVDVTFLPDRILDRLPTPSQIGATQVGGIDLNKPRTRGALAAVLALAIAPEGFTVADLTSQVRCRTGQSEHGYTRHARETHPRLRQARDHNPVRSPEHRGRVRDLQPAPQTPGRRVQEVPRQDRRRGPRGPGRAPDLRQLPDPQDSRREDMAAEPPASPHAFHPDLLVLAEPGRAVLQLRHRGPAAPQRSPQRPGPRSRHPQMGQRMEHQPHTLHLDKDGRTDPRINRPTSEPNFRRRTLVSRVVNS